MVAVHKGTKDDQGLFSNTMITGDIRERIKLLVQHNNVPLAYLMAKTHNITEFISPLKESLKE